VQTADAVEREGEREGGEEEVVTQTIASLPSEGSPAINHSPHIIVG
jgi:hypothetical protein